MGILDAMAPHLSLDLIHELWFESDDGTDEYG